MGVSNETSYGVMRFCEIAKQLGLPKIVSIQNSYSLLVRSFTPNCLVFEHPWFVHPASWWLSSCCLLLDDSGPYIWCAVLFMLQALCVVCWYAVANVSELPDDVVLSCFLIVYNGTS